MANDETWMKDGRQVALPVVTLQGNVPTEVDLLDEMPGLLELVPEDVLGQRVVGVPLEAWRQWLTANGWEQQS